MSGRRRIGVFLVHEALARGGAERVLVTLANGLDPEHHRVHVVTTREPGELAGELAPRVRLHSLRRRTLLDRRALRRFADLTREQDADIVHTHSHTASYFARLSRTLCGGRWRHVVHDHYPLIEESPVIRFLDRLLLRKVHHYFAVSEPLLRYATDRLGLPESRCERLLNGVRVPDRIDRAKGPVLTIAQVARVTPQKDHEMAISVAARLRDAADFPNFQWWVIGRTSSDHAQRCEAKARRNGLADHVRFLGERDDVEDLLRTAHVGVLTSREEGLPIALLEYMAAALPVVVTDVGDCGEVVRAAGGGAVVPHGDIGSFERALRTLGGDRVAARRAGNANRRFVSERYSSEAMVRRVAEVYAGLLDGDGSAGRLRNAGKAAAPGPGTKEGDDAEVNAAELNVAPGARGNRCRSVELLGE